MALPNDIYYDRYQLPIFISLICILWMLVGIRIWAFRKHYCGWKSWRGASTLLTLSSAIMCTFYVIMLMANYFLNNTILRIRDNLSPNPANYDLNRDPKTYSDAEIETVIRTSVNIYMLQLWIRIILVVALWLIKFAFMAFFFETREVLNGKWRLLLYFAAAAIAVTLFVNIWTICKDIIQGWIFPTKQDVLDGIYVDGIRFVALDADNEFVLAITNIVTDILLVIVAGKTVTALHKPLSAASVVFVMVSVTISVAVGRLILNGLTMNIHFYSTHATIPLELLAELETFFAAIVSCLPGLRVLLRTRRAEGPETYVQNITATAAVVVPDPEMVDLRSSTRFSDLLLGVKYNLQANNRPSSEDPFTQASSAGSSYAMPRQLSMA
ncbi:hypothetical protein FN846DRAFT_953166 [Sphaerosporella brunnea]|uniref:Integral membrane protein n=1 Tax=Sphaerosporella brunnea TaxID=1250544 RepID=A0A5J5EV35_9PEZI|nr:hypothetical protein FN846DRAFT_953166 [Sphaerosporella brunnea]